MTSKLIASLACAASLLAPLHRAHASGVVTVYSVDGLHDGNPSWYSEEFAAFTKATGINVQYVEAGSGGIVERALKEKYRPQADVLVTLPPFIQRAEKQGLLQPFKPATFDKIDGDKTPDYVPLVNNYMNMIYNTSVLKEAPKTFEDLLDPKFKNKLQYSTPGQSGDGTAVLIQVIHVFGKDAAFDYFKKLQDNNVGPSASTGKLTALVNKSELYVANGDLQMNMAQKAENPNIAVFWPAGKDGMRSTFALPYVVGLVKGAPNAENGKKLIDFLLDTTAQTSVSAVAIGLPVRDDVKPTDKNFASFEAAMKGVSVWAPDWAQVLKDLPAYATRWREATGS